MPSPSEVNWTSLSAEGKWTLRWVALPLSQGCSPREIASAHGRSVHWLNAALSELRDEIKAQQE
jgi:hypothetical protein